MFWRVVWRKSLFLLFSFWTKPEIGLDSYLTDSWTTLCQGETNRRAIKRPDLVPILLYYTYLSWVVFSGSWGQKTKAKKQWRHHRIGNFQPPTTTQTCPKERNLSEFPGTDFVMSQRLFSIQCKWGAVVASCAKVLREIFAQFINILFFVDRLEFTTRWEFDQNSGNHGHPW